MLVTNYIQPYQYPEDGHSDSLEDENKGQVSKECTSWDIPEEFITSSLRRSPDGENPNSLNKEKK